jgi:lipoprotein-anchoring transpeptidase ErfK/SrfK
MPLIMRFSRSVTDASAIEKAITVRANGAPVHGAWYWLSSTEAHYRPASYWPSRATITVDAPLTDVAAGQGLAVDDSLTLHYRIGPSHVATINPRTLRMTVTNEHRVIRVVPVSLGKAGHRTLAGIKVVESKSNPERMISDPPPPAPGAYNVLVPFSVRVTNSGEFVHAAPWNPLVGQSDQSHGCTNLNVRDASWFYSFSKVGDVVRTLPGSGMPTMQTWDGWGDWNVSWSVWSAGGALRHTT